MRSDSAERVRSPRAVSQTAPGRLWASCSPVLRPVRGVHPLDWDRRRRVTPAKPTSQETWPEAELEAKVASESRGEAPEGGRAPSRSVANDFRTLVCGAPPRPDNGAANTGFAPFGAPLPSFLLWPWSSCTSLGRSAPRERCAFRLWECAGVARRDLFLLPSPRRGNWKRRAPSNQWKLPMR